MVKLIISVFKKYVDRKVCVGFQSNVYRLIDFSFLRLSLRDGWEVKDLENMSTFLNAHGLD